MNDYNITQTFERDYQIMTCSLAQLFGIVSIKFPNDARNPIVQLKSFKIK